MKNNLKIPKNIIIWIIFMFFMFIFSLFFVSKYKIEESFPTQVQVSETNDTELIVTSENIYKINYDSKLVLFYADQYNEFKIDFISKKKINFIVDISPISQNTKKLIPGSTINARVIYSSETILNIIMNYFK